MKIYKSVACFIIGLATVATSYAQKESTSAADAAFSKGDYYDAVPLYKKAFNKEKNKVKKAEILFKTAESYRMANDFENQEVWYSKAIKGGYKEPIAILRLADALKYNGKYDEAIVQYNAYKNAAPNDPLGDDGVKSSEQAQKWKDKPTRFRVDNMSPLNSKYRDFGISYSSKDHRSVIFTSARQETIGKNNDGWTGEKFMDLFEASVDKKGKWSSPKPLTEPVNSPEDEGFAAVDKKGNAMFFTRCGHDKNVIGVCQIYYAKRKGQAWENPELIPLASDSTFTVGQPSLSADEQTLYFVSDMPGGQGGKDLWMTTLDKKSKTWGPPVNLGNKINTPEDDMFPYIASDNTLYFASKGHLGMGGLDIFKSKMNSSGSWEEPVNMKYPINTSADDFAYVVDELATDHGYLSSNRQGGKGNDDIYSWTLPPLIFTVSGKVSDADTKANLEGASIELFGSDGTSIPYKTDKTGTYKFDLKPETKYRVSASMKDYLNKYLEVSTVGVEQSKDFVGDFEMKSTRKPIVLPNILYDLAKWDLRPESKVALDELVQTMNDNPTIVIELGSHTDSRPIPMTNDTLSQRRAQSVVDFLIEKGIDADRLNPKGYGEKEPRTLTNDMGHFKAGDVLTDAFINNLKSKDVKEEAHQLNRRTEFKVLRNNYVKGQKATENVPTNRTGLDSLGKVIEAPEDSVPVKVEVKEKEKVTDETPVVKPAGKIYVAEKKDTYMSVAKKFGLTMKDLKAMNGLKAEPIYEGMELKVEKDGDYTDFDAKFYTLEKGDDSFSKIAKKLNLKTSDLKKLNKGVDEGTFHAGKRIRIAK